MAPADIHNRYILPKFLRVDRELHFHLVAIDITYVHQGKNSYKHRCTPHSFNAGWRIIKCIEITNMNQLFMTFQLTNEENPLRGPSYYGFAHTYYCNLHSTIQGLLSHNNVIHRDLPRAQALICQWLHIGIHNCGCRRSQVGLVTALRMFQHQTTPCIKTSSLKQADMYDIPSFTFPRDAPWTSQRVP